MPVRTRACLAALAFTLAATPALADDPGAEIVTVRPDEPVMTVQRLPNFVGVSGATAGATALSMNIVIIPPGATAQAHVHDGYESAIYILEGEVETRYGTNLEKSVVNRAGDFLFIPAGVPHEPTNLSKTDAARAIVARNDPDEQEHTIPYSAEEGAAE